LIETGLGERYDFFAMSSIETTATFESPDHLKLDKPVDPVIEGQVRVIVIYDENKRAGTTEAVPPRIPDFAQMRREIFGEDVGRRALSAEDSEFIRDRGRW